MALRRTVSGLWVLLFLTCSRGVAQNAPAPSPTVFSSAARASSTASGINAVVHFTNVPVPRNGQSPYVVAVSIPGIDWAKWITIGVALINLVVVSILARMTRRDRIGERKTDQAQKIGAFWIENLVIQPNFEGMRAFFDDTERDMREYYKACSEGADDLVARSQRSVGQFSKRYDELTRKVVEPLDIVSPSLSENVALQTDEIQEAVTDFFSRHSFHDDAAFQAFRSLQKDFWQTLYEGQKRIGTES